MPHSLRLVLVLHQHQPVGNLDSVNEDIYASCYLPLLETLARYPSVPVNLHTSGSLLDWIGERHPEYLNRLRDVVASRRIEVLGGGYHDPILPMLSPEDRRGQMDLFSRRLGQLFGERPRGMWLPERIWEPSIAADMAACDIEHTVLDDFHFHAAGLTNDQLRGYYLTEAAGQLVAIFAGDEQLRYLIPFAEPEETIAYLRGVAQSCPGGVMVYADDAEKFGAWPGMHERMQQARWLDRFLAMLAANSDWLHVTTLGETIDHVPPLGKVYLPEGSYREMERWSTLADRRGPNISSALPRPTTDAGADPPVGQPAPRGTWRNFRVIYPEVNEMYCRMLSVSRRCEAAAAAAEGNDTMGLVRQAQQALYRAQCGCAYWHGIFGGVYMPHLRQAVYRNLIAAEKLLDTAAERTEPWLSTTIDDFNLDVHKELLLSNGKLSLFLAPEFGGTLYELDERETGTNLLATFARRPEAYHGSPNTSTDTHPAPVIYDTYARKSLIDHFFDAQTTLDDLVGGRSVERGDFVAGRYRARLRRQGQAVSAQLSRSGQACGRPVTVTKRISLAAESSVIDLHYELTGLSPGQPLRFAIEFNFAGMPPGCADRYFIDDHEQVLPDLGSRFDLATSTSLRLVDRWLGLDVRLAAQQPAGFWAFPICTVSRSQRGLETIQQSVTVMPHWLVSGDRAGRFEIQLQLSVVNSAAGRHPAPQPHFLPQQRQAERTGQTTSSGVRYVLDQPHAQIAPKSASSAQIRWMYGL